jgi:hypothetical protein
MLRVATAIALVCAAMSAQAQPQVGASEQRALQELDACIAKLDPALDVGYARVVVRCPTLTRSLEQSGWAEWLPRGWKEARNDLSAGSLAELRTLIARELELARAPRAPDVKRLHEVLAGLGPQAQESASLWSRFRAWMRTVIERNRHTDDRNWLDKMIQHSGRSQTFIDLLTYVALGLLIVLAALILVNELRAAGLLKSRQHASASRLPTGPGQQKPVTWGDIEQAASGDKPRLLLGLVISKLAEQRRIPPAGALTARELTVAAEFADAADRARLSDIATSAERVRYSPAPPAQAAIDRTVAHGRELLERLGGTA